MEAKEIIKAEYTKKMAAIQELMDTAPDTACCILALLLAEAEVQRIMKDVAGAIDHAKKGVKDA